MAKSLLRLEARKLRKKGLSVKRIAQYLKIAKSSASIWTRDIILTVEQLENLRKSSLEGAERGRIKNALLQKERWKRKMETFKKSGIKSIGKLTDREFLIAGLALYWGEGYKKGRRLQLCNSDPKMIKFLLLWLQRCFSISSLDIRCRVGINYIHIKRENIVKEYWSRITSVPLAQFTRTSFKKVENKKLYDNFNDHYGTLSVEIVQPSRFYGKIIGLIDGLHANMPG
ncbi:MAG: hypothetical protein ACD_37C00672G0001 [uncultured bacterium]|nr:MAG: hypothetical protein ACD_37C00672G0001 [uncultured bacterium]OGH14742.1 MAG: hypothetical protein A2687_02720 [Candidatus Levybacteria bacterium RIFCSPHIGHO2_01_FULL_38_26]